MKKEKKRKKNKGNPSNTEKMAKEHPWEMNTKGDSVLATGGKNIGKREVFH